MGKYPQSCVITDMESTVVDSSRSSENGAEGKGEGNDLEQGWAMPLP